MKQKNFKIKEFLFALLTGAAAAVPVFLLGNSRGYEVMRSLSDACFVPAVVLLGVSGILFARNDGTFDVFGYSIKYTFFNHYPGLGNTEDFADYREKKAAKRKSPINILFAGLIFLVAAVVFMTVHYKM